MQSGKSAGKQGASIWSRTFITLCAINLFQIMGQSMMLTIMPLYVRDMGATEMLIGIVVGVFAVTALLSRPFMTPAFDSFSKKWILFGAELLIAACSFLYGLADTIPTLIAVRMLHGVAMGCTGPLALALVSETLPSGKLGSGISIFSMTQALSQAVGPALGLWLVATVDYQWTYRISGISMLFASALIIMAREPAKPNKPKYKIVLNRCFAKGAIPPAIVNSIASAANTSIMSFIAIYGGLQGVGEIGLYFSVHAITLLVTRPVFGKLADRFGYAKVIIPGMLVYAIAFGIISVSNSLPMFLLAAVVAACGYGTCAPLLQAIVMGSVSRKRSGAASSTNYTGIDISMLIGPMIAGMLIEFFYAQAGNDIAAYQGMYRCEIGLVLFGLVLFVVLYKLILKNMAAAKDEDE
jgi:MFS family permease